MDVESKLTKSLDDLIKSSSGGKGRDGTGRFSKRGGSTTSGRGRGVSERGRQRLQREPGGDYGRGRSAPAGRPGIQGGGQKRARTDEAVVEIRVARRVYVHNLSFKTTWQSLKDYFKSAGNDHLSAATFEGLVNDAWVILCGVVVYAEVMRERKEPGARSKGCGIVEFESPEEAAAAITDLHLTELDGREILVREDREDKDLLADSGRRAPGGGGKSRRGFDDASPGGFDGAGRTARDRSATEHGSASGLQIVVHGLPYAMTWQGLKDLTRTVTAAGGREVSPVHADVAADDSGQSRGYGTVKFESKADAASAVEVHAENTVAS